MPAPPTFSVIIPTFGRPKFLAEALESVRVQSIEDFECLVVDDASPEPVVIPFTDARFRIIRRDVNGGPAAARNSGLRQAKGLFVAFLDDDDLFLPRRLEIAARGLDRAPLVICGSGRVGSLMNSSSQLDGNVEDVILNTTTPHLGSVSVVRELCLEFNEIYLACEDLDWWLRTSKVITVTTESELGWQWRAHHEVRVVHGSQARIDGSIRLLEEHNQYFQTHRRAAGFRWFRIAMLANQIGDAELRRLASLRALASWPSPYQLARFVRMRLRKR